MRKHPSGAGILIVEDNADLRETLALLLDDLGYPIAQAVNGQEALVQLQSTPLPGLILLDLIMPIMNGWVFGAELRQASTLKAIPVVVLSGTDDAEQQALALGAVGFLGKPTDLNELVTLVVRHCG